jgi:hypothetical protein
MKNLALGCARLGLPLTLLAVSGCAAQPAPAAGVACGEHPSCGLDGPACSEGRECISIVGCPAAVCISTVQACLETCGVSSCAVLESFPAQLACEDRAPAPGRGLDVSCEELEQERNAELASIQSCSVDADCGQELHGTSCGCTRNWVARADANTSRFSEVQAALSSEECGGGLVSTCDCPEADGFACRQGRCTWNYINGQE